MADNIFDELRRQISIVDVIGNYVPLSKVGKDYKCLCPFHSDTHASMSIEPGKQIYKCFSCGAKGNVFTFVQNFEKISFIEAVKKCCYLSGVKLPSELDRKEAPKQQVSKYENIYKILDDLSNYYSYQLKIDLNSDGNKYICGRHLDDQDLQKFRIGYSPDSGFESIEFLRSKGYQDDEIISSGIASNIGNKQLIDRFRGRVIFSIFNPEGRVVAFCGRRIREDETSKYSNSPETVIFHKSNVLYNYHNAQLNSRKDGYCYIVEGFMDAIALSKAGINNVVATMGTAFTKEHIELLKLLRCELRLLFDSDGPGQDATYECIKLLLGTGLKYKIVVPYTNAKDSDELLQLVGKEEFTKRINVLESVPSFVISYFASKTNFLNHEEAKEFMLECVNFFAEYQLDDVDIDYYANEVTKLSNISKLLIVKEYNKRLKNINKKSKEEYFAEEEIQPVPYEKIIKTLDKYEQSDHQILQMMIKSPIHIAEYRSLGISLTSKKCRQLANIIIDKYYKNEEISIASLFSVVPVELQDLLGNLDREQYPEISMTQLATIVGDDFLNKLDKEDLTNQLEQEIDYDKQLEVANKILEMRKNSKKG